MFKNVYENKMKDYDKFKEAVQFLQDSLTKINSDAVYKILQNITPENRKEKIMELCLYKINRVKIESHIKFILQYLFGGEYLKDALIPMSFFETELGQMILEAYKIPNDIFLSASEAAKLLNCSRQYFHYMIQNGKIKPIKVGNSYVIKLSDILPYVE